MRIATWNVNSIRTREPRVLRWLEEHSPDVLCLQETKVTDDVFPHEGLRAIGYEAAIFGQKTYNGVALISKVPLEDVVCGLDGDDSDEQTRLIAGTLDGVRVYSAYVPNGSQVGSDKYDYKLRWYARLAEHLAQHESTDTPLALCGDFNVAPSDDDAKNIGAWADSVLCHDAARNALAHVAEWGLTDAFRAVEPDTGVYSWWDYRRLGFPKNDGLRIDHIYTTTPLLDRAKSAYVDRDQRKKGACPDGTPPSDHAPVVMDFD
jgi:exodeoxyribonuclease-3